MKIKQKANATVAAIAPKGYGITQFEFSNVQFADENAVKAWMDAGGYEDYEIVATSKGFEVTDTETKFEAGTAMRIDNATDGVAVFVGKLTAEEPAAEPTAKSDDATGDEPAAEVVEAADPAINPPARQRAADPAPAVEPEPAADPVVEPAAEPTAKAEEPADDSAPQVSDADRARSLVEAIADKTQKSKGVYEASELGRIVNQLGWVVYDADYSGLSEGAVAKIKEAALALLDAFMQVSVDAADELTAVFRTAEEREANEVAQRAAPEAEQTADIAALVAAEVARAMQPVTERITVAEQTATEAVARADAATEEARVATERADAAEAQLQERVEADNARGQTRKGAEDLPDEGSISNTPKTRSVTSKKLLGAFGSRHARD